MKGIRTPSIKKELNERKSGFFLYLALLLSDTTQGMEPPETWFLIMVLFCNSLLRMVQSWENCMRSRGMRELKDGQYFLKVMLCKRVKFRLSGAGRFQLAFPLLGSVTSCFSRSLTLLTMQAYPLHRGDSLPRTSLRNSGVPSSGWLGLWHVSDPQSPLDPYFTASPTI